MRNVRRFPLLDVLGDIDVGDGVLREGRFDSLVHDVVDVRRPHDPFVVGRHVREKLVEADILLIIRANEVVKGMAGDGQHRLAVALGVVEAVEQMYSAGPRSGHADAEPVGEFGITAGRKGGRLLVADLNKPQLVLIVAEGFKDGVNAISREAENGVHTPID